MGGTEVLQVKFLDDLEFIWPGFVFFIILMCYVFSPTVLLSKLLCTKICMQAAITQHDYLCKVGKFLLDWEI